jgi:alpha-glucosidase
MQRRHQPARCRILLILAAFLASLGHGSVLDAQSSADTDDDGVPDIADCNPVDARVATLHRYYFDLDGDQSGNASNPATLCSATPFAGTVLWMGDPDDDDPAERIRVVPRGSRMLGLDFTDPAVDGLWHPELVREIGANATTLQLLWNQIETAPGVYNGPQVALLDQAAAVYAQLGLAVNLTISPISQTYLTVPPDIVVALQSGALQLSHPTVIGRFNALLDFIRTRLMGVQVSALQIGHEVDRYLEVRSDPDFWQGFIELFVNAQAHAGLLWPGLSVGITATAPGLLGAPASELMRTLNTHATHVSVSYFPRSAAFDAIQAENVRLQIQTLIATAHPRPLLFQSVGSPSAVRTGASSTAQAQFFEAFFAAWDEYAAFIPFAAIARLHDWSAARAGAEAVAPHANAGGAAVRAAAYYESLGLTDYLGRPKAAYETVRTLALEHGWWRAPFQTTRSTLIGFTPALYDREGTVISDSVLSNVMTRIGQAADLVLLQFDNGVPWTEALTDTGVGPLPYSANVRETWEKYRSSRPPGTRLAVAINAIGVPRRLLAPYWGVGEDFYLDQNFEPVGTGVVRDFENRLLPPEWRNRRWDDPAVQTAFTSYAKRVIQFFSPQYLIIGVEANLTLEPDPSAYQRFVALQRHVYEALKADPATANVPIVVSFVAEHLMVDRTGVHYLIDGVEDAQGLRQRHLAALEASLPYLDVIGFSVYPLKTRFGTARLPASMFDHLFSSVRAVTSKPMAITETGYPAAAFSVRNQLFQGSLEKQAQYYRLLFAEAEEHRLEFVTSFAPFDMTPFMDRLREAAAQNPPTVSPALVEFFKYFEFMGLFWLDGAIRPAGQLLLDLVTQPPVRENTWITPLEITSPSGTIRVALGVHGDGRLYYAVERNGRRLIDPSPLGLIVEGGNLGEQVTNIEVSAPTEVDETYPIRGVHARARDHHRAFTLAVRRAPAVDRTVHVEFRVFDDGVAYRYEVPGEGFRTILGEASAWVLPEASRIWHQVNTENYEANYRGSTLGFFNDDIGGPITAEVPGGGYLLLTEAALLRYSGMTYDADLASRTLRGEFLDDPSWTLPGGTTSPWRVVLAVDTLDQLVNSDVVSNLNAPPDPDLFSEGARTWWIKSGRAVWSWWSNTSSGYSFDIQKQYVDFAHSLRAEHQVIDAGWETGFPGDGQDQFQRLSALAAYARVQWRNVGLWVWKYWYELADPVARNAFFAHVADAGAVGVKVDNVYGVRSDAFANIELQERILRDAAAHHLMINFHGIGTGTGLQRTYPNEVTREGFMGLELNGLAWDRGLFVTPNHNAAAPFVRLVAGPGDYTPVTLDPRKIGETTFAHQLATAGIFTSPLQHWADDPGVLLQQPAAVDLLRTIPVEWEETKVLPDSEIGSLALFARRAAGRWYLFGINGDAQNLKALRIALSFLGPGRWDASTIADSGRTSLTQGTTLALTNTSSIAVTMLGGGGYVAVLVPSPDRTVNVKQGFSSIPPSFTTEGWQQGYSMLRDHAQIVSHSLQEGVPWPEALLSSDYQTYSDHLREYWERLRAADMAIIPSHPRYLMLNPIETISYARLAPYLGERDYMPLPSPWNGYTFDHPNVKTAFTNYAIAAIEFFQPRYVAIGIEANILLAQRPDLWAGYKEFNAHVYAALKARYPSLVVFTTVQYEHMLGLFIESEQLAEQARDVYPRVLEDEVKVLLQDSDLFALSTYPYMVENNILIGPSTRLDRDYYDRAMAVARATGKRLAVEQSGYISRDLTLDFRGSTVTLPGSEARQVNFVEQLLSDAHVYDFEFVFNFVGTDYGLNYGNTRMTMTWAYAGLRDEYGRDKPALAVWDAFRGAGTTLVRTAVPTLTVNRRSVAGAAATGTRLTRPPDAVTTSATGTMFRIADERLLLADAATPERLVRQLQLLGALTPLPTAWDASWADSLGLGEPWTAVLRESLEWVRGLEPLLEWLRSASPDGELTVAPTGADTFLVNDSLLVAPVLDEGATDRPVIFPPGDWVPWGTDEVITGPSVQSVPLERATTPVFIRLP